MSTFLLAYRGGGMAENQATQASVMAAWTAWFERLGAALVDGGNPLVRARTIDADGSVSEDTESSISGYSIIAAEDLDTAVEFARSCPVLESGARIEVCETSLAI